MSTQSRLLRAAAVAAAAFLLMGNICNGEDDDPTPTPTLGPALESITDFQLVARVRNLLPTRPNLDLPPQTPGPTPLGDTPPVDGTVEVEIADLSEGLAQECDLEPEDVVDLHWTTTTGFDPPEVLDGLEEEIGSQIVAALGTIFMQRRTSSDDIPGLLPTATPIDDCILVADQIFIVEEPAALPTPRPVARTTPSPTPTPTPEPQPSPTPTQRPERTETPVPTATQTAEPTDPPTATPRRTPKLTPIRPRAT